MSTATRPVPPAPDRAPTICIGVCTFRRPSQLRDLLLALQSLTFTRLPAPMLRLLVVDNAPEGGARRVVEAVGWDGAEVIHVGASNIATARNVVLERGTRDADLLAIIDDDEVPTPEWLEELLLVQQRTAADLVVGPVVPRFPDGTPKWLAEGGFFDLDAPADGARLDEGITGNALLVSARIEELGLRFDESLGAAGGEDQLFFRVAVHRGAEIRYASHALVHEPVPQDRLRTSYLLRREFRKGNTL